MSPAGVLARMGDYLLLKSKGRHHTSPGNRKSNTPLHKLPPNSQRLRAMSQVPQFPPPQLVQIVRVTVSRDPSGVLVARSADLPGRAAFASDLASFDAEI